MNGVPVTLAGAGARVRPRFAAPLDHEVHAAVSDALAEAGVALQDVDTVVTIGSDVIDAILVPMRTELYGGAGRGCLNVTSGAGDAFGAAVATLEAGQAHTVLLVGWAEGGKGALEDALPFQADPFHARRVGADAKALLALQAHWLASSGRLGAGSRSTPSAAPVFCDGAVALVLRAAPDAEGSRLVDCASSWRPYTPGCAEDLDPQAWVGSALEGLARAGDWRQRVRHELDALEACAPSAACELRAMQPLLEAAAWDAADPRINRGGGGAAAWFGPATGLHSLAQAHRALRRAARDGRGALAAVLDLAGPIGQATTAILLRQGGDA